MEEKLTNKKTRVMQENGFTWEILCDEVYLISKVFLISDDAIKEMKNRWGLEEPEATKIIKYCTNKVKDEENKEEEEAKTLKKDVTKSIKNIEEMLEMLKEQTKAEAEAKALADMPTEDTIHKLISFKSATYNYTAPMCALYIQQAFMMKMILKNGAKLNNDEKKNFINIKNTDGDTLLYMLFKNHVIKTWDNKTLMNWNVDLLINYGADLNIKYSGKIDILNRYNRKEIYTYFRVSNANIKFISYIEEETLVIIYLKHYMMFSKLIKLCKTSKYGRGHKSFIDMYEDQQNKCKEIVKFLVDNGADINIPDKDNKTPLKIAQEGAKEMINIAEEAQYMINIFKEKGGMEEIDMVSELEIMEKTKPTLNELSLYKSNNIGTIITQLDIETLKKLIQDLTDLIEILKEFTSNILVIDEEIDEEQIKIKDIYGLFPTQFFMEIYNVEQAEEAIEKLNEYNGEKVSVLISDLEKYKNDFEKQEIINIFEQAKAKEAEAKAEAKETEAKAEAKEAEARAEAEEAEARAKAEEAEAKAKAEAEAKAQAEEAEAKAQAEEAEAKVKKNKVKPAILHTKNIN